MNNNEKALFISIILFLIIVLTGFFVFIDTTTKAKIQLGERCKEIGMYYDEQGFYRDNNYFKCYNMTKEGKRTEVMLEYGKIGG